MNAYPSPNRIEETDTVYDCSSVLAALRLYERFVAPRMKSISGRIALFDRVQSGLGNRETVAIRLADDRQGKAFADLIKRKSARNSGAALARRRILTLAEMAIQISDDLNGEKLKRIFRLFDLGGPVLKSGDIAEITGVSTQTQRNWRRYGYLPKHQNRHPRFDGWGALRVSMIRGFSSLGASLCEASTFADNIIYDLKTKSPEELSMKRWVLVDGSVYVGPMPTRERDAYMRKHLVACLYDLHRVLKRIHLSVLNNDNCFFDEGKRGRLC